MAIPTYDAEFRSRAAGMAPILSEVRNGAWCQETLSVLYDGRQDSVAVHCFVHGDVPDPGEAQLNEYSEGWAEVSGRAFLEAIVSHQSAESAVVVPLTEHRTGSQASLCFARTSLSFDYPDRFNPAHTPARASIDIGSSGANLFFLDALSVIEDGYKNKKDPRQIELTTIEEFFLGLTAANPELMHAYHPRLFEYFVASALTNLGFSRVKLSRYWQDYGRDIWAAYCEGEETHAVVVEVKHFRSRRVGIDVIDRLNGVRDREGASKGMVVTNSSFSKAALDAYSGYRSRIALIDFDRLRGFLESSAAWHESPSGLWTPLGHSPGYEAPADPRGESENREAPPVPKGTGPRRLMAWISGLRSALGR